MRCLLLAIALVVAVHCDESLVQSVEEQLVAAVKKNSPLLASPRITGGAGTFYGLHPYIVSIYYDDNFVCGGTIYNARTIITSAVCVGFDPDQSNGRFTIKVGDHKRVQKDDYEEKRNVQDIIMHQKLVYQGGILNHVIALLTVREITYNSKVQPISIPAKWKDDRLAESSFCFVAGWGLTNESNANLAWRLREAYAPVTSRKQCWKYFGYAGLTLTQKWMCSFNFKGDQACFGDLGGPLVCYDNTYTAYQMGIIQFGNGCDYGFSGHTRLSRYKTWIENNAEYDY